jgi:hypothetical protein
MSFFKREFTPDIHIVVTGSRFWSDEARLKGALQRIAITLMARPGVRVTLYHGGARGADQLAAGVALKFGWDVVCMVAEWKKYGKRAGPMRNQALLETAKPQIVIAFHDDLESSKGTKDMLMRAKEARVPILLVSRQGVSSWP